MRSFYALLTSLLICISSFGQCPGIPVISAAVPVTVDGSQTVNTGFYWICPGLNVSFDGTSYALYIEENCTVSMAGIAGNAFVKANSTVTLTGTAITATHDPAATVIDNGTNNTVINCMGPLTFDYSSAPPDGCGGVGIDESGRIKVLTSIFPNPAQEQLNIIVDGSALIGVRVMDTTGRIVLLSDAPDGLVDLTSLRSGDYVIEVLTEAGEITRQISVL